MKAPTAVTMSILVAAAVAACAQQQPSQTLPGPSATSGPISAADLRTRLYIYADDSMQGRETGTAGNKRATDYVAAQAARIGLEPAGENGTYFQDMQTTSTRFPTAPAPGTARNVIAVLRGSDPALRDEYVAIGAHNDHVGLRKAGAVDHDSLYTYNRMAQAIFTARSGKNPSSPGAGLTPEEKASIIVNIDSLRRIRPARRDSINNGADDDGSGTVTVLEIAEAMAAMPIKPKRSILFVWHTGEEKGLLGSKWFTEHPTVPREKIVAQLNIDMVGRGSTGDVVGGGANYLQLVGSRRVSKELGDLVEQTNAASPAPFKFDYFYDANGSPDRIYCRSDHYNYARYNIPITFFTTGLHADYHQVTDEPQYINYEKMAGVGSFIEEVALKVANLDHRLHVDTSVSDPMARCVQ